MKAKAVALVDPGGGIGEELARKLSDLERVRGRAMRAHTERTVPRPQWQPMEAMSDAHMARLAAARDADSGEGYAPDPVQGQDRRRIMESVREERRGTLARFIEYLRENGILEGMPRTFEEQHAVQKYAYLARELGAPLHYEFDFLENGAYSAILAIDLYAEARPSAGAPPFSGNESAGSLLVRMVLGRGRRTLQAMTFAVRDIQSGVGRDEFVSSMYRERSLYSRRVLEWAYDRAFEAIGGAGDE